MTGQQEGSGEPDYFESKEYATDPQRLLQSLLAAQAAFQERAPAPVDIAAIIQVYGSLIKLVGLIDSLRDALSRCRAVSADANDTNQDRDELRVELDTVFRQFFELLCEFDGCVSKLDLGVLDIYYPGVSRDLIEIFMGDVELSQYHHAVLAPMYQLEPHRKPFVTFQRLLRDVGGYFGYKASPARYAESLNCDGFVPVTTEAIDRVSRLLDTLDQCRHLVGELVREHWSFRDLAEVEPRLNAIELRLGDTYSDIRNSQIVNRSKVQESFIQAKTFRDPDPRTLMVTILQITAELAKSGTESDFEVWQALYEELGRPKPRRVVCHVLWQAVLANVPALRTREDISAQMRSLIDGQASPE